MKKLYAICVVFVIIIVSCENSGNVDNRLKGVYFYKKTSMSNELRFSGKTLKEKSEYSDGNKYDFSYKIKFVVINNEGGVFYAISSYKSDDAFDNEYERKSFIYVFDKNGLIIKESGYLGNDAKSPYTHRNSYIKK